MMIDHVQQFVIPAAYSLLPPTWASAKATAYLLAIGLHEGDGFTARKQYHGGPARSFWQWEYQTVKAVMVHPASKAAVDGLIDALCYRLPIATVARQAREIFEAMQHNDTLACGLSRCLLRTVPAPLVGPEDPGEAFTQYLAGWNPGAYRRGTNEERLTLRASFFHSYAEAWARVTAAQGGTTT